MKKNIYFISIHFVQLCLRVEYVYIQELFEVESSPLYLSSVVG